MYFVNIEQIQILYRICVSMQRFYFIVVAFYIHGLCPAVDDIAYISTFIIKIVSQIVSQIVKL